MEKADKLFEMLAAVVTSIGTNLAAEWIFVGDGADWIWDRIAALAEKVGFDSNKVTDVVDYYHAARDSTRLPQESSQP